MGRVPHPVSHLTVLFRKVHCEFVQNLSSVALQSPEEGAATVDHDEPELAVIREQCGESLKRDKYAGTGGETRYFSIFFTCLSVLLYDFLYLFGSSVKPPLTAVLLSIPLSSSLSNSPLCETCCRINTGMC